MGNRLLKPGRPRATRRTVVMGGGAALSVLLSLAPAAFAETYSVVDPVWQDSQVGIGTNGDDSTGWLAVSHGGCATGGYAVAIGESTHECTSTTSDWYHYYGEASGGGTGIGLLGADAGGTHAVSDHGDSQVRCWCGDITPPTAISGTGSATGETAISGTGNAYSTFGLAVSGTGDATSSPCNYDGITTAVSITGDASGCTAVSGTGAANGEQTSVSVLGTVTELLP